MKALVLGDGMLGGALRDAEWPSGVEVVVAGHDRFDIRGAANVEALIDFEAPDVVVNTVAYHRLAECEKDPGRAFAVNATGAKAVAMLAPTVYVSTDYVFTDGGPHDECLPGQQPRSVYGRSKLAGELATLENGGIVVRVSGLFDADHDSHKGLCFPAMVATGWDPLKLPTDQVFSPTYAPDAAQRIAAIAVALADPSDESFAFDLKGNAGARSLAPGGIYHAANAGSVSWAGFAEEICAVLRHRRNVTGHVAHDPLRPTNSSLKSTRLPPLEHWRFALDRWIEARQARIVRNRVSPLRSGA